MENFIAKNTILQNNEGTNQSPLLADIIQGKNGRGHSILTKINTMLYSNVKNKLNKNKSLTTQCKNYRSRDENCGWTGKMQNVSNLEPDSPDFWNVENWIILSNPNAQEHTCSGTKVQEVASNQMREFVRKNFDEGITNFKNIKNLSGVPQEFADHAAELLGDDQTYNRIIQRKRKRKNPDAIVPEELKTMPFFKW